MASKNQNKKSQKAFKPEDYIKSKARQLPIYKCYKCVNTYEDREMSVIVIRQHPQGTFTFGGYLIDKWCLGVKDTLWFFSVEEDVLDEMLDNFRFDQDSLEEISYAEAHNWVWGAHDFAMDAGIEPCKDFALTQYILAEDNDDVELIEYEFGKEGEYYLLVKSKLEASKYIPTLNKNLGEGNYTVEIDNMMDDDDDEGDDDDWLDGEDRAPFEWTPAMEYTYTGGSYPTELDIHFPKLKEIVDKRTENVTDEEMDYVMSLPEDEARHDLHNLILYELGQQWGKDSQELEADTTRDYFTIGNSLMFLTHFGTPDETLPVVFEVMRQNEDFRDYNFGDCSDLLLNPVLYVLTKDNPRHFMPYLLEEGLAQGFKIAALELLEHIAQNNSQQRQVIIDMAVELLAEYKKDLPQRTICDGSVVAFAIGILVGTGASEHLPLIEEIYATGLVDEAVDGHISDVRKLINSYSNPWKLPKTDPYSIRDSYREMLG